MPADPSNPSMYLFAIVALLFTLAPVVWCLILLAKVTHWVPALIALGLVLIQPWLVIPLFLLGLYLAFDKDNLVPVVILLVLEFISGIFQLALALGALAGLMAVS